MRKFKSQVSTTLVGVVALLALWGVALVAMAALPEGRSGAAAGVAEPTGVLISQQDMAGQTAFYRELRAAAPVSRPARPANGGDC